MAVVPRKGLKLVAKSLVLLPFRAVFFAIHEAGRKGQAGQTPAEVGEDLSRFWLEKG